MGKAEGRAGKDLEVDEEGAADEHGGPHELRQPVEDRGRDGGSRRKHRQLRVLIGLDSGLVQRVDPLLLGFRRQLLLRALRHLGTPPLLAQPLHQATS